MKFAEGHWVMRRGVRAAYAADAYETRVESERLTIIAATQILKNRGMTIGGPTITLRISSPLAGSASRGWAFARWALWTMKTPASAIFPRNWIWMWASASMAWASALRLL